MKNFIKVLSAVLLVTAINACTLQEAPDSTTQGAIVVTAQTVQEQGATNVPATKTTIVPVTTEDDIVFETHWEVDDAIGIFSPEASSSASEDIPVNNAQFTALTAAKKSDFSGTMFWGDADTYNFYAYYPYESSDEVDVTEVPISLPSAQTQSEANNMDHIGDLDYMVAKTRDVAKEGHVSLAFNHVFTMIEFQITGTGDLTQINLIGADPLACEGTIDLTQTPETNDYYITKSSTSNFVSVTCGSSGFPLSGTAISVYMMVLPRAQSEDEEMAVALKINGNWKILDKILPDGGFVRGKKYEVTLNTGSEGWYNTMTDSRNGDENTYKLVVIGGQIWMAENLAYLPSVVALATGSEDEDHSADSYCYVNGYNGTDVDDAKATSNYTTYGVLYNWNAAMAGAMSSSSNPSGVQGICPAGWHLPSDAEWTTLTDYLGGVTVAGGKLKETGTDHWSSTNTDVTNSSGFTALPGGCRSSVSISSPGTNGYWWSSTMKDENNTWYRLLYNTNIYVYSMNTSKNSGYSVRCLRN
jgi:uncharacterized protein (TIGR02145 family)